MNKIKTICVSLCFIFLPTSIYWQIGVPYNPSTLAMYSGPGIFLTDFFVVLVILQAIITFVSQQKKGNLINKTMPRWLIIPLILLIAWSVISVLFAMSKEVAFYYLVRWFLGLLFVLSLLILRVNTSALIKIFVLGLCLQSIIAVLQFVVNGPLHLPGELTLEIEQPRAAIVRILDNLHIRAYGLTFHPNVLGGFLMVGIFLAVYLILTQSRLWLLALPVLFAGLYLSFSRSAWLAFGLSMLLFGVFSWINLKSPRVKKLTTVGLFSITMIGVAGVFLTGRFNFQSLSEFTSIFGRGELIRIAMDAIKDNPLLGIGPGNFPLFMLQYRTLDPPHFVHNVPLLLASEVGILGGLIWYWLWIKPLTFLKAVASSDDPLRLSLICAWMGLCIIALFDSFPWNLESGRLLSLSLLAWIGLTHRQYLLPERNLNA